MSRILPLPADAIYQIHSSKNITSLQQVITALLENSLDANATKVDVTVDFRRGGCTVEDDGDGIPSDEFGEEGGLGKMYHTSKRLSNFDRTQDLHGWHGTYLASLAALSFLSTTSRQAGSQSQATLTLHQGKAISRQAPPQSIEYGARNEHGTQVTVRDLFGNMPVRVKQRALAGDSGNDDDKAWHQLKHGIAALLLAWPKPCSIKLVDSNRTYRKVHLAGSHPSTNLVLTRTGLRQLESGRQATYGIKDALPIVFQAGLAMPESRSSWVPVSASAVDITVKGLICLEPAPTKQCQFVSLGVSPCDITLGSRSDVYDAINKVFVNSSFGAAEDLSDVDAREKDRRKRDRRYKGDGYTQRQLHARKGVDRWPMFVLQVKFRSPSKHTTVDNVSDATLKSIVGVLEATVMQWLAAHHFRPRKQRSRRKNEDQQRPASTSTMRTSSPIGSGHDAIPSNSEVEPGLPRAGSSRSGTVVKKRKIIDLSGRPQTTEQSSFRPSDPAESPFSMWSRIKTGKGSNTGKSRSLARAVTAPERRMNPSDVPEPAARESVFTLPAIEAGALSTTGQRHAALNTTAHISSDADPNVTESTTLSSENFGSVDDDKMVEVAANAEARFCAEVDGQAPHQVGEDEIVDWTNPRSKLKYRVNSRTGVVLPVRDELPATAGFHNSTFARQPAALNATVSSRGNPLSLSKRATPKRPNTGDSGAADTEWLPRFLQEWNNPTFRHQDEEHIPVALPDGPALEVDETSKHRCGHHVGADDFKGVGATGTGRLDKASLRSVRVISQVDRKFILCKVPAAEGGETLVLVDQHAASERVILEELLAELCETARDGLMSSAVITTPLENATRFHVSVKEHELFERHSTRFADWGILYRLWERDGDKLPASQDVRSQRKTEHGLVVTHLPPGIAERCTLVPSILIEMLRSEIWDLASSSTVSTHLKPPLPASDSPDGHAWLHRIGSCPKRLIEMLNSRACRSAIMFNDELSKGECEELMGKLAECAFPFMCAHGRVSMVPLVGLGEDDSGAVGGFAEGKAPKESFTVAFERSMARNNDVEDSYESIS